MKKKILLSLTGLIFTMLAAANYAYAVSAKDIDQLIVFGDSLGDAGVQNENPQVISIKKKAIYSSPAEYAPSEDPGTWSLFLQQELVKQGSSAQAPEANNQIFIGLKEKLKSSTNPTPIAYADPILKGTNYAAGGATSNGPGMSDDSTTYVSPSVTEQINYYLANNNPKVDPDAVYFVWAGSNDLLKVLEDSAKEVAKTKVYNAAKIQSALVNAAGHAAENIAAQVHQLQAAGAKRIVVIEVPHIGDTPLVNLEVELFKLMNIPNAPTAKNLKLQLNGVVTILNQNLLSALPQNGSVLAINVNNTLDQLTNVPTKAGFTYKGYKVSNNTDAACSGFGDVALTCIPDSQNSENYVFEDQVHPTAQTHHIIADYIDQQLLAHKFPS
jgi:outer membrane lipase/esterase